MDVILGGDRLRTIKDETAKANALVREARALKEGERLCSGTVRLRPDMKQRVGPDNPYLLNADGSIQTRPCKNSSIKGGSVCHKHGGSAPQVRAAANRRLLAMVEPAYARLEALVQQNEHLPTSLGAIRTVIERAGTATPIGPLAKETGDRDMRPQIIIGIKVGGIAQPVISVGMLPAGGDGAPDDAEEGEIVGDDDSDE